MSSNRSTIPPDWIKRSSKEPPKKSWTRADAQFLIGAILALLIWGLQLIGVSVNLWLGAVVLAIAFILMIRAFWAWEGPSRWHVVWRVITIALASMIYVTAVGWQIRAEWIREHPKTAIGKIIPEQSQPAAKQTQEKESRPQENESVKKNKRTPKTQQHSQGDNSPNVGSIRQGPGSIAQVGGQGNQATINNFGARLPRLVKVSEIGSANRDGSYTTECVLRIESDVSPGHLTFEVNAQGLQEVNFYPNVDGVTSIQLANEVQGANFYKATANGPSGEYILSVKTSQKTHITVGANFN